jgi:outer membrane protein
MDMDMDWHRWWSAAMVAGAFGVLLGGAAVGAPRAMTVEDAVALALRSSPRLAAVRERRTARGDSASEVARRMLPAVRLSDEFQVYDRPFVINFGMNFTARDQVTNTFVAAAAQPVLGLLHLERDREALSEAAAAAEAQGAATEADLRAQVETQFLRFFEAQAIKQIALASRRELADQVGQARVRVSSGVLTRADLLRIEVAAANARQQELQAESQSLGARAQLFAAMGISASEATEVTLVEPHDLLTAARGTPRPVQAVLAQARLRRPELGAQQHLTLAAERQASARGLELLPEIDLEAAYTRIDGQIFAPANSAFVGVRAQWAIWEWGAGRLKQRAALAEASAARHDAEALERAIEADVEGSLAEGDAARGAVEAAESAITSAEEAFRVTEVQVAAGAATTTDLLQAQAELAQARLNLTRARYELALSTVSLRRAQGG